LLAAGAAVTAATAVGVAAVVGRRVLVEESSFLFSNQAGLPPALLQFSPPLADWALTALRVYTQGAVAGSLCAQGPSVWSRVTLRAGSQLCYRFTMCPGSHCA
jgi:hypothetical protein